MDRAPSLLPLPIRFDAARVAAELAALDDQDAWHPVAAGEGAVGEADAARDASAPEAPTSAGVRWVAPLIAVDGAAALGFANAGPMRPTRWLRRCPALGAALAAIGRPLTRVVAVRTGAARVRLLDVHFHWLHRTRVHLVVSGEGTFTGPGGSREHCGPGEVWARAPFVPHELEPASAGADEGAESAQRLVVVADVRAKGPADLARPAATRAGGALPAGALGAGRMAGATLAAGAGVEGAAGVEGLEDGLPAIEPYAFEVLTPDEVDRLCDDLAAAARTVYAGARERERAERALERFAAGWRDLFADAGHAEDAYTEYGARIHLLGAWLPPDFGPRLSAAGSLGEAQRGPAAAGEATEDAPAPVAAAAIVRRAARALRVLTTVLDCDPRRLRPLPAAAARPRRAPPGR